MTSRSHFRAFLWRIAERFVDSRSTHGESMTARWHGQKDIHGSLFGEKQSVGSGAFPATRVFVHLAQMNQASRSGRMPPDPDDHPWCCTVYNTEIALMGYEKKIWWTNNTTLLKGESHRIPLKSARFCRHMLWILSLWCPHNQDHRLLGSLHDNMRRNLSKLKSQVPLDISDQVQNKIAFVQKQRNATDWDQISVQSSSQSISNSNVQKNARQKNMIFWLIFYGGLAKRTKP